MKKGFLILILIGVISTSYSQQRYRVRNNSSGQNHELGISLGVSNYLGDLAWKGDIPIISETNPSAFRPAGGIYYRNNFTDFTSFRTSFSLGGLYANDAETNNDPARINRNLHFRSIVADLSVMLEWNILPYRIGDSKKMFTPFIGVGITGFYFNPQAELNGRWIDLQPLGTEGQGLIEGKERYSLFQYAIPGVFGFKANISNRIALSIEFQYKYTFTDYLDDVSSKNYVDPSVFYDNYITDVADEANAFSYRAIDKSITPRSTDQRGDPKFKDNYYFALLSISYSIGKSNSACPSFRKN